MSDFGKGFMRIHGDLQDFGKGFARICETLGKDSQGFTSLWERIHEDSQDFGKGFTSLGKDLQGFMRLWERIHETLGKDSPDLGKGFTRICRDSQDFGKGFVKIHGDFFPEIFFERIFFPRIFILKKIFFPDKQILFSKNYFRDKSNSPGGPTVDLETGNKVKKSIFISAPYFPGLSEAFKKLFKYIPILVCFRGQNTIKLMLIYPKDMVSSSLKKDVVYKWTCTGSNYKSMYVGETSRSLS